MMEAASLDRFDALLWRPVLEGVVQYESLERWSFEDLTDCHRAMWVKQQIQARVLETITNKPTQ